MGFEHQRKRFLAVQVTALAVLMLVVCYFISALGADAASIDRLDEINIVKGQTWKYTPTFPSGLTPTLTVATSTSSQPSSSASFFASSGYA